MHAMGNKPAIGRASLSHFLLQSFIQLHENLNKLDEPIKKFTFFFFFFSIVQTDDFLLCELSGGTVSTGDNFHSHTVSIY